MRGREGDVDDDTPAGCMASERALSDAVAHIDGWLERLRLARGTAHAARMRMIPSRPRILTSTKGRSFGLSYAGMVTGSTGRDGMGVMHWILSRIG